MESFLEYRCSSCKKLLGKGGVFNGSIQIKCKRCGTLQTIVGAAKNEEDLDKM